MEAPVMSFQQADHVLGHTSVEQQRLIRQARVLAPLTERFLRDAGISSGMRVLDIGCGMGDVTMIAAQLVGCAGQVTSIDLDQASVETAQRRAAAFGFEKYIVRSCRHSCICAAQSVRRGNREARPAVCS